VILRAVGGVLIFLLGFWSGSCWQKAQAQAGVVGSPAAAAR